MYTREFETMMENDNFIYNPYLEGLLEDCNFVCESIIDDLKIKQEDLTNPSKVKSICEKITNEQKNPKLRDVILDSLLGAIIAFPLGAIAGGLTFVIAGAGALAISPVIGTVIGYMTSKGLYMRRTRILGKITAQITKAEKMLKETDDPDKKENLKKAINSLKQSAKVVQDSLDKNKEEF